MLRRSVSYIKRARAIPNKRNKRMHKTSHNTTLTPRRIKYPYAAKYLPAAKSLSAAIALAALVTVCGAPAIAATQHHHHRAARALNGLHMYAGQALDRHDQVLGEMPMSESRAQAMHDCNMKAQPYSFSTWETTQFAVYGNCMTEHGQMP
jgi:hypothetical protein